MDQLKQLQHNVSIKDNDKGQKIIAAVYMVTHHLADNDPLKHALRTHSVTLATSEFEARKAVAIAMHTLLGAAVLARLISEKNTSIIQLEIRHYAALPTEDEQAVSEIFKNEQQDSYMKLKRSIGQTSLSVSLIGKEKSPISKNVGMFENKNKRQHTILSFINDRKSAAIKDIAALFPETSEKTIQRELSTLVALGKITKRGNKRWSLYMAVGA